MRKFFIILGAVALLLLAGGGYVFYNYYFVFGEGVMAGELNYLVYKGYVFKTYEGKLIQSGIKGVPSAGGGIQSNEKEFSVEDPAIADSLMRCSGRQVELHYQEYKNPLPWRGVSAYVADRIIAVR